MKFRGNYVYVRGVARIFQRGVTVCQNEGTYLIIMSLSLKEWVTKGGHGHPRTPLPPSYAPGLAQTDLDKMITTQNTDCRCKLGYLKSSDMLFINLVPALSGTFFHFP